MADQQDGAGYRAIVDGCLDDGIDRREMHRNRGMLHIRGRRCEEANRMVPQRAANELRVCVPAVRVPCANLRVGSAEPIEFDLSIGMV